MTRRLVIVTTKPHLVDDLAVGAAGIELYRDFGLDAPMVSGRWSWRVASGHAARLAVAGVVVNFSAPGPGWLAGLDPELTGRRIWAGRVDELGDAPHCGYAKPAEAKVAQLPARWYDHTDEFATAGRELLGADAWVQVADTHLDIIAEYRSFVRDRVRRTTSAYVVFRGDQRHPPDPDHDTAAAVAATDAIVAELGDDQPAAYVLDVAELTNGRFVVLEANPAWASGHYRCDPAEVLATIVEASDSHAAHGHWRWQPDPYLVRLAQRLGPLRPWYPDWEPLPPTR